MAAGNTWIWLVGVICSIFIIGLSFFAGRIIFYLRKLSRAILPRKKKLRVVFVLGGTGTGQSLYCAKLARDFGYEHIRVGALLMAERDSDSQFSPIIQNTLAQGKLVPSEITIKVLQKAILESGSDTVLVDGFPRNEENRIMFEKITKIEPEFLLFFECSEDEMVRRHQNRFQGREDGDTENIRKRFETYKETTLPILNYYDSKGKVRKVDAGRSIEEVYRNVKRIFSQVS